MAGLGRRARSAPTGWRPSPPTSTSGSGQASWRWPAPNPPATWCSTPTRPPGQLSREIQDRIRDLLPDPVPSLAEANTGDFPAIRAEA